MRTGKVDILMIAGKTHSGKGEFAKILENKLKVNSTKNVIRCSLSTFVRKLARDDFFYEGDMDSPEAREFMAKVYEYGNKIYPYHKARRLWERDIFPSVDYSKENIVIVESFREKKDIVYFEKLQDNILVDNIRTLKIERPNFKMMNYVLQNHISEIDLNNVEFDNYILNDGSIEDLEVKVDKFIEEVSL